MLELRAFPPLLLLQRFTFRPKMVRGRMTAHLDIPELSLYSFRLERNVPYPRVGVGAYADQHSV